MLAKFQRRTENKLSELARWCFRHWAATFIGVTCITVVAFIWGLSQLQVDADLSKLLPQSFESVKTLDNIKKQFGGIGYVAIAASGPGEKSLKQFADDVAPRLEKLEEVVYVDYQRPIDFFRKHALFYANIEDLLSLREYLVKRQYFERAKNDPLFLTTDEVLEEPSSDELARIRNKIEREYTSNNSYRTIIRDNYYYDADNNVILILVKPSAISINLKLTQEVVSKVKSVVGGMDLLPYGPNLKIEYGGSYTKKVAQQELIERDLVISTAWAIVLVFTYVFIHFRRLSAILLLMGPLLIGLLWTYAFAGYTFSVLTVLTAFIGAILLGLGVDHGIHLLQRYEYQFTVTDEPEEALAAAFGSTGRAIIAAAITTMVAFAGLSYSEFKAFQEFGIIASSGMAFMVTAYALCLPAGLGLLSHFGWKPRVVQTQNRFSLLGQWIQRRARPITLVALIATTIALSYSASWNFKVDFRELVRSDLRSFQLDFIIDEILGHGQTPIIGLPPTAADQQLVSQALRDQKEKSGAESAIHLVLSSADLVPKDQVKKAPIIAEIHRVGKKIRQSWVSKDQRSHLRALKKMSKGQPFTYEDIPMEMRRRFEDLTGKPTGFVLVFSAVALDHGDKLDKFVKEVRSTKLTSGEAISIAGEPLILHDIIQEVKRETPSVLFLTLFLVLLTITILLGGISYALLAAIPAALTMVFLFGFLATNFIELNYMNVILITAVFGISVDGGIHLLSRLKESWDVVVVLEDTGKAIFGSLLTSLLGFTALSIANYRGLESMGRLCIAGVVFNGVVCLIILPAVLSILPNRKKH